MNLGLSKAKGDYIAILESDDVLAFDALQHLYDLAEASDADVAKADFWLYWSQPEERLEPFGIIDVKMAGHVVDPEKEVDIFYRKPSIWSAMYRRSFLLNNDIRFLETPGASYQDASFNFKVWACAKRVIFSTKPILKYRQDNESSSVNSPGKVYCVCDEYDEMEKFLRLHKEKRERFEGVKERMKYDSYLWNYDRLDEKLKKEFLDRAVAEFRRDMDAGDIDWELFEPWAEADLLTMIKSPDVFRESRSKRIQSGKINTLKHYFRIGGLPLVMKIASSKYMRR